MLEAWEEVAQLAPIEAGRRQLADWQESQPDNYFVDDRNFQRTLEFLWGEDHYRQRAGGLYQFGRVAATTLDDLARQSNLPQNLPRLERFDSLGRRIESVSYHPSYTELGRHIYATGIMSVLARPGQNLACLALFYLSAMNGEAGHNCPLACTAGVIKTLQYAATTQLAERFLPGLLSPDYPRCFTGAQYLTEVQGGSDVGANASTAFPLDTGEETWYLRGEKWFCSNVTADLALVTARLPGGGEGTRGIGLFLVPRLLEDGTPNQFVVRRLKEKLGTASLATAEVEFQDAQAFLVGTTTNGIQTVMTHVINTSRVFNAVGCSAHARRAYVVARSYAQHRRAFGQPIIHFPLVQATLTQMRADGAAMLAGTLRLVRLWDELELGQSDADMEAVLRLGINLNKFRTAVLTHEVIQGGIEILGGNGAIESFSVLPRLLRDNVVYENWEGTHNVLLAQAQRDMRRFRVHEPFFRFVKGLLQGTSVDVLRREGEGQLAQIEAELESILGLGETEASLYFRPLMERLTDLYYAACLGAEAPWESYKKKDNSKRRLAEFFFHRRVAGRGPKEIADYADSVARLCAEMRPGGFDMRDDEPGGIGSNG